MVSFLFHKSENEGKNSSAVEPGDASVVRTSGRKLNEESDLPNCSARLEGPTKTTAQHHFHVRSVETSLSSGVRGGVSVAIVVGFEGPLGGEAQVFGLLVRQLGQLHPQFVQMGSSHLLVQLRGGETGKSKVRPHTILKIQIRPTPVAHTSPGGQEQQSGAGLGSYSA